MAAKQKSYLTAASLVFDKDANLCYQLPQFKEVIAEIELNTNGTINAAIIEPALTVPDEQLDPLHYILN